MPARILIVEDNQANLELARYLLEFAGYSLLAAADGAEGFDILRREQPDLVLCDLQMPIMDGYGMVRKVREDPSLLNTTAIAVSALSMAGDRATALAAGFDGYLSKPIDPEKFVEEIEAFLPPELRALRPTDRT